ncbi:sulfotransferase [Sphingobium chlorophenolicum L-1]|uniref:Sulfotransferase n=1 Tax=Sphingobium chlorophenolicum L-1 TaxID=690566 RepID=F6EWQ7_SPHCR|nr:sulfotransferase [Sphingobium chlorophenolicum]AEG49845.1 sulfotransferase [Sphingobium chlorophenolicum L-1]
MSNDRLPHFVIIGAVKGATTWIHNQLQDNPAIYLPAPEPHFFSQDHALGLDHYRRFFDGARPDQMLGEKSADYLAHPDAAARLAAVLPKARLVVQLRNPVDRAYSDYKMLFRRGTVTEGPEHYLDGRPNDQPRFLEDGLYARHLRRWLDHFDADQIKVILFEDVKAAPEATVAIVSDHIGAPCHYSTQVGSDPRNDSSEYFLPLPVRTALAPLKQAVRPLRGNAVFERVRGVFARQIAYPPLAPALRQRMVDYYARDIADLEDLIGRDLSHWRQDRRLAA